VFGRVSGTGFRLTSYNVDGGSNAILATPSTVQVSVAMNAPHTVTFTKTAQYQVYLDAGAATALYSITAPTLANDKYWYDSGTAVTLILNGAWGRSTGTGSRLKSYTINGGSSVQVATAGTVTVLSTASIMSAENINTVTTSQFQLTLDNGAVGALSSIQAPPISGDNYWYDSGTVVQYVGQGVFGRSAGSGMRITSWWFDSNSPSPILTAGTFTGYITMTAVHSLHTTTVTQYQVSVNGTYFIFSITPPTVGGDNYWYDGGGPVSLVLNGTFGRSAGLGNRMTGYSINGGQTTLVLTSGRVTVLSLTDLASPQTISVSSTTQVKVSLDSTSLVALNSITPPTISGDDYWYDTGVPVTLTLNGIWGRTSGSGLRLSSYTLNGGTPEAVATTGVVTVLGRVTLESPQSISSSDIFQYYLTVNGGSGITYTVSPQIQGDDGWYDAGTSLQVSSLGVYARNAGVGHRVISWNMDGGQATSTPMAGEVTTTTITMTSAHVVNFGFVTQYEVSLNQAAGVLLRSISNPTIGGDDYWYDSGSSVVVTLNGTVSLGPGARYRLVGYSNNGSPLTKVTGTETVVVLDIVSLSSPQTVEADLTAQYLLQVSGGNDVTISKTSPTADNWYDNATSLVISSSYVWNVVEGQSRQSLTSYTLDGSMNSISRIGSGLFDTPAVIMNETHDLQFNSVTQYYVSFIFSDSTGNSRITPSSVQLAVQGVGTFALVNQSRWLDTGSTFTIASVGWQGVDVKPAAVVMYLADKPMTNSITTRVYSASITVVDLFGIPVGGASAQITFANGTSVQEQSRSDGTIPLGLIPIGGFNAVISSYGFSTSVEGNASTQSQFQARMALSTPLLVVIVIVIVSIATVSVLLYLRRSKRTSAPDASTDTFASLGLHSDVLRPSCALDE
jgi:hypothetical protein